MNTVIRYMKCLKKITSLARANDWMAKAPFLGIRFLEKEIVREVLTMTELPTLFPMEKNRQHLITHKNLPPNQTIIIY